MSSLRKQINQKNTSFNSSLMHNQNQQTKLSTQKQILFNKKHSTTPLINKRLSTSSSSQILNAQKKPFIKLPNCYYNDKKEKLYLNRSKSLCQNLSCYQSKNISFSQRKRITQEKLQNIIHNRRNNSSYLVDNQEVQHHVSKNNNFNHQFIKVRSNSTNQLIFKSNSINQRSINNHYIRPIDVNRLKSIDNNHIKSIDKNNLTSIDTNNLKSIDMNNLKSIDTNHIKCIDSNHIDSNNLKWKQRKTLNQYRQLGFSSTQRSCISQSNRITQKYKNVLFGKKTISLNKKLLTKQLDQKLKHMSTKKWNSPYQVSGTIKQTLQSKSKPLLSTRKQKIINSNSSTQLKVLNLDRMFRKNTKNQLRNVVPLPVTKIQKVTARTNLIKTIKSKDRTYDLIEEYNQLLKLTKFKVKNTSKPKLAIKGANFVKNPTFQQLMGLKLFRAQPFNHMNSQQAPQLNTEIFLSHCMAYKTFIRKNFPFQLNLISGLTQQINLLNFQAFTLFHNIFINCQVCPPQQKIKFFSYFFIQYTQNYISKKQINTILEVLVGKSLTNVDKVVKVRNDLLNQQEKKNIFLKTLDKVLFANQYHYNQHQIINHNEYQIINHNEHQIINHNEQQNIYHIKHNKHQKNHNKDQIITRDQLEQIFRNNLQVLDFLISLIRIDDQ